MTTFLYTAKKDTAETVSGQVAARNQDEAIEYINQLGLLPVSVLPESVDQDTDKKGSIRQVKLKELSVFTRQLSNLLKSGISILRALNILKEQTQSASFRKVISSIVMEIKNGKSLSECLSYYPHIFSSLYIIMVHAGEESGNLQEVLYRMASHQQKQRKIISKVRMALAYPAFMAVIGVLTVFFLLTFVMPKMAGLFENMQNALPWPTVILLNLSHSLSQGWIFIVLIFAGIGLVLRQWIRSHQGRKVWSYLSLRVPLLGKIILKTELARFCRTLSLLFKSGTPILQALQVSIPVLSNESIKKKFTRCREDLKGGGSLGESLKQYKDIPPMMGHLIAVGEESGNLTEVLDEIAETYEQETDENIKVMTTLFEPMMMLIVGLAIGFIVFAMLLPIFQIEVFS
jgi:type II secretory pathway component PulF